MFEKFVRRENTLFETLQALVDAGLDFIVIGGYAVAAYRHRFSVDADLVVRKKDIPLFEEVLRRWGFLKTVTKDIDHPYAPVFIRYEKKGELPVSIDMLVDAVAVRQTGAAFSVDALYSHATLMKIVGTEKEVVVRVPSREVLIALKLHAGRLTDLRDVVALCAGISFDLVADLLWRGGENVVKEHVLQLRKLIETPQFLNSFNGMFMEKGKSVDIAAVKELVRRLLR